MPTKAETLIKLKKYEKRIGFVVPKIFFFTKKNYKEKKEKYLEKIKKVFKNKKIIIRSSSKNEDQENKSNAGKYISFQNVSSSDILIDKKILLILKQYDSPYDQVIVQEFVENPNISGVIFTRNINNNSPYYFLNIDSSGKTDLITSGKSSPSMKTMVFFRDITKYKMPKKYFFLITKIKQIENILRNDRLDLEFCIKKGKLIIFQCRPLKKMKKINDHIISEALKNISMKIEKSKRINPLIPGSKTYFSNMADWNPAEMIGNKPTNLSISLYSELITDQIWALQRKNYGYKDLSFSPLMLNLGGSPYIDLRTDFNSFIPEKLDQKIQKKAMEYYLKKISKNKNLHDKVEFDIIETAYDFESKKNLAKFLTKTEVIEYLNCLRKLTNDIFTQKKGLFCEEIKKIKILEDKIYLIKKSNLSEIHKIFFLVNTCKNFGTLPFSGLARSAFIATKILRSFHKRKIISSDKLEKFYQSINSVTNEINNELKLIKNRNDKKKFLKKFGHLRPSTYSISSKNYKENFKNYFSKNKNEILKIKKFNLDKILINKINLIFKKNHLKTNYKKFINFATDAIRLREYSKLIFTKCIDEIFNNLISLGNEFKIGRDDLEHISIKSILKFYNNVESGFKLKKQFKKEINENKKNFNILKLVEYPDFIKDKNDIFFHTIKKNKGNYITTKKVNGPLIEFSKVKNYNNLSSKILLLKNADPGYDFIFSKNIIGLITEYGGANSHMSIRCLELGIPAIIGIGSKDFNFLKNKKNIEINSLQKTFKILN